MLIISLPIGKISVIQHISIFFIKEAALPPVSDILGNDEQGYIFTAKELNMIMEVDAEIDHDNMLNAFRQSAAEAMVHRQEELQLDKRFVAAEQAILSHNLHTHDSSYIQNCNV